MIAVGPYILHFQATRDGGCLIRAWKSRRWLNWLICLLRRWVPFRLHMAGHQWQQMARILGGAAEPLRFTEGKARCRWEGTSLRVSMGRWNLQLWPDEVARLDQVLGKLTPEPGERP